MSYQQYDCIAQYIEKSMSTYPKDCCPNNEPSEEITQSRITDYVGSIHYPSVAQYDYNSRADCSGIMNGFEIDNT